MTREMRRQVTEMGLSPDAEGRVIYDLADRPGKRARAFCSPVRIPDEVYLVLRPHGGQNDWQTLQALLVEHVERTSSLVGKKILDEWLVASRAFVKLMPRAYKQALIELRGKESIETAAPEDVSV